MMKHALTLLLTVFCLTEVLGQKQSVRLDGVDDFVTLDCPLVSNNFMLSFNVNLASLPSSGSYLFDGRLDDKRGYYMFLRQNGLTDIGWENGLNNYHFEQVDLSDVSWVNEWNHIVVVQTGSSLQLFIQGELRAEVPGFLDAIDVRESTLLGRRNDGPGHDLNGSLDNLYIGTNSIEPADIERAVCLGFVNDLAAGFWGFNEGGIASQGTNPSAVATLNSGAYLSDLNAGLNCGEGICLSGTIWDEDAEGCIVANPADTNLDGCVQLNDLLDVLSAYGDCLSNPTIWQCGSPVYFEGYNYQTVQLGSQCWFAENVKVLPEVSPPTSGSESDNQPHAYVPQYYGDNVLEAMGHSSFASFGVLYNFLAVEQWSLCPQGWHVPEPVEWDLLVAYTGGSNAGYHLKNSPEDSPAWNGSNAFGFNATPSGVRDSPNSFSLVGSRATFWANKANGAELAFGRYIHGDGVNAFSNAYKSSGMSVRCIKDSE